MPARHCATGVFFAEMGAVAPAELVAGKRDRDEFDAVADHLIVVDHAIGAGAEGVVGTYRLIREAAAAKVGRFYSSGEYDLSVLMGVPGREAGAGPVVRGLPPIAAVRRCSCCGAASPPTIFAHQIDIMFGCASLPGTDPDALANELTYLYQNHLAPPALRPARGGIPPGGDAAARCRTASIRAGRWRPCRR